MPYNLVGSIRAAVADNWNALPASWQYAISTLAAAASVPLYQAATSAVYDWHRLPGDMLHAALIAWACHFLPKPSAGK